MKEQDVNACLYAGTKSIKRVYKFFLTEIEKLRDDDILTSEEFDYLRSKILDIGNGEIRELQNFIENYSELTGDLNGIELGDYIVKKLLTELKGKKV